MRELLLTGFGAFPGVADNPTTHIAAALDGKQLPGLVVRSAVLPVAWPRVRVEVAKHVAAYDPATVVHLGVATQAVELRIEVQGTNQLQFRVADVDGNQPMDGPIEPSAPDWLITKKSVCGSSGALR